MSRPPEVLAAAELATLLRGWLRSHQLSPQIQASALAYEAAALIALHATSVQEATTVVDQWATEMKEQIRILGVGQEHP